MNIKNILAATAVALVTAVSASAVTTTYNDGDLLLGFRATSGSTVDYVVDLGQGFNFNNSFTFSTSGIAADLAANFGAGWATSSTLKWSVFGTLSYNGDTGETNLLYTTNPSSTPFNQMFDQSSISSPMSSVGSYFNGATATANNPAGVLQTISSNDWTYANSQPGGTQSGGLSFGAWTSNEATPSSSLKLNVLHEGSATPGTALGTIAIANDGSVSFTTVPEPSTYAMIVGGLGLLGILRRRAGKA